MTIKGGSLTVDNETLIALHNHAPLMARNRADAQIALARHRAAHHLAGWGASLDLAAVARGVSHTDNASHAARPYQE